MSVSNQVKRRCVILGEDTNEFYLGRLDLDLNLRFTLNRSWLARRVPLSLNPLVDDPEVFEINLNIGKRILKFLKGK